MKFLSPEQLDFFAAHGYAVLDDWINTPQLQGLAQEFEFLFQDGQFKKAQVLGVVPNEVIRADWTLWLTPQGPPLAQAVLDSLNAWQARLNQSFYCGITNLEAHLAFYPVGPGYQRHLDQGFERPERKISFVLYLNLPWNMEDGGELVLYAPNSSVILEKLSPLGGRLVIFRSEIFSHEVLLCQRARRSLTGWFRSDAL